MNKSKLNHEAMWRDTVHEVKVAVDKVVDTYHVPSSSEDDNHGWHLTLSGADGYKIMVSITTMRCKTCKRPWPLGGI